MSELIQPSLLISEKIGSWRAAYTAVLPSPCSLAGCFLQIYVFSACVLTESCPLCFDLYSLHATPLAGIWLCAPSTLSPLPWSIHQPHLRSALMTWVHSLHFCQCPYLSSLPWGPLPSVLYGLELQCLLVLSKMSVLVSSGSYKTNKQKIIDW